MELRQNSLAAKPKFARSSLNTYALNHMFYVCMLTPLCAASLPPPFLQARTSVRGGHFRRPTLVQLLCNSCAVRRWSDSSEAQPARARFSPALRPLALCFAIGLRRSMQTLHVGVASNLKIEEFSRIVRTHDDGRVISPTESVDRKRWRQRAHVHSRGTIGMP